jgi:hypothetical protein
MYLPAPDDFDVHTSHCCNLHGCKYSDPHCGVANGWTGQEHPCPYCVTQEQYDDAIRVIEEAALEIERFGKLQRYSW